MLTPCKIMCLCYGCRIRTIKCGWCIMRLRVKVREAVRLLIQMLLFEGVDFFPCATGSSSNTTEGWHTTLLCTFIANKPAARPSTKFSSWHAFTSGMCVCVRVCVIIIKIIIFTVHS